MCALMGWTLGYIKVPYIETSFSFWIGFASCFAMLVVAIAIYWEWNKNKAINLFDLIKNPKPSIENNSPSNHKILISLILLILVLSIVFINLTAFKIRKQLNLASSELNDLKQTVSFEQKKNNISLLLDLINKLDSTDSKTLTKLEVDQLVAQIAAMSSSFKISKEWDVENKEYLYLSTERGLLLITIFTSIQDSNHLNKIKENVSFYGADLRNADLQGMNLSNIDLQYAQLQYANLQGTNFNKAKLNGANLMGANLNKASLVGSNLIGTKLNWAKINDADLHLAKLDSSDLSNATIQNSKLNQTSLINTILCNAILYQSDLSLSTLKGTNISNANLSQTKLNFADIYHTNLSDVILDDAIVQKNWIEQLDGKNNVGLNLIHENYSLLADSTFNSDSIIYRLKSKSH